VLYICMCMCLCVFIHSTIYIALYILYTHTHTHTHTYTLAHTFSPPSPPPLPHHQPNMLLAILIGQAISMCLDLLTLPREGRGGGGRDPHLRRWLGWVLCVLCGGVQVPNKNTLYSDRKARTSGRKYNAAARIQSVVRDSVRRALSRTIETKESTQTINDGTELFYNNFVTLSSNLLATSQGSADPQIGSTGNRIGDEITLMGVKIMMMVELNERYSDVTFRLLVVKAARQDVPSRSTLFHGLSGNKMIDTINTERYSILASKTFKITAPNAGTTGAFSVAGTYSLNDANAQISRATKIVKLWIPGAKFNRSKNIKYENGDSRTKFFDYHAILYAYSNYSTSQDTFYVARVFFFTRSRSWTHTFTHKDIHTHTHTHTQTHTHTHTHTVTGVGGVEGKGVTTAE
jgi:hypothetical protein